MKHRINVKGAIIPSSDQWIYDWFEMEATSPQRVFDEIAKAEGKDLEVWINSGGGSVHHASEIYTELKSYSGNVETRIVGLAASAASVIAMAGNRVLMAPTSEIMIHNASTAQWGDYRQMDKASESLKVTNKTIANAYRIKSGMEEAELLKLMDEETWLSPQDALARNLIDEIMFEDAGIKAIASTGPINLIPEPVINGLRNKFKNGLSPNADQLNGFVNRDELVDMLAELKAEILNQKSKEPEPDPVPVQNMAMLFLKL